MHDPAIGSAGSCIYNAWLCPSRAVAAILVRDPGFVLFSWDLIRIICHRSRTVNNALREFLHITNCRAECSRKLCDYRVITAGVEFALLRWGRVVTWKVVSDAELALWLDNLRSAISFSLTSNIPNFVSYIILIRYIDIYIYIWYSLCDGWNASLVLCMLGCAVACAQCARKQNIVRSSALLLKRESVEIVFLLRSRAVCTF